MLMVFISLYILDINTLSDVAGKVYFFIPLYRFRKINVTWFLSFVHVSFGSSDMCVPFGKAHRG